MIDVLMCGSVLDVKGGMVSVVKNYLGYQEWGEVKLHYIPTHIEKNKFLLIPYFGIEYLRILFGAMMGKYQMAHLHTAERGSFYRKAFLVRTLRHFGVKTILHHHAAEFELFYASLKEEKKQYVNSILELADVNIVLSKRLVPMIKDKAPRANVEVLYNAVNTYPSNPYNNQAKNILFLGRLGNRKGTYDLLEAIKLLDEQIGSEFRFYLCGDGDLEGVKKRIAELNISHRIAHIGWTDGEMKKEFLANTLINVLPSYNEGLPMTMLETMAYGIPNISTSIASIPEVLRDGENGFLIKPGDVNLLASRIKQLVDDKELRKVFSDKSYLLITRCFSLNHNIERLKEMYKKLLENISNTSKK